MVRRRCLYLVRQRRGRTDRNGPVRLSLVSETATRTDRKGPVRLSLSSERATLSHPTEVPSGGTVSTKPVFSVISRNGRVIADTSDMDTALSYLAQGYSVVSA